MADIRGSFSALNNRVVDNGDGSTTPYVSIGGAVTATTVGPGAGLPSAIAASTSSTTLFAANPAAKQRIVYNPSTAAVLYLAFGTTATTTVYTVQVPVGATFEFPTGAGGGIYTGVVSGVWASATGSTLVTEVS